MYLRLRLAGIITKAYSVTRNVLKTLLTKSILVREEARGWIPENGILKLIPHNISTDFVAYLFK